MTQWEYATATWTETATSFDHSAGKGWKIEQKFELNRPGAKESELIGKAFHIYDPLRETWKPGSELNDSGPASEGIVKLFDMLNVLGAEGWELISESIRSTAISNGSGYPTIGRPISIAYIFKRCIS